MAAAATLVCPPRGSSVEEALGTLPVQTVPLRVPADVLDDHADGRQATQAANSDVMTKEPGARRRPLRGKTRDVARAPDGADYTSLYYG